MMESRPHAFIVGEPALTGRIVNDLAPLEIECCCFVDCAEVKPDEQQGTPQLVICVGLEGREVVTFTSRLKSDPLLKRCWRLALCREIGPYLDETNSEAGIDDVLLITSTPGELRHRVRLGLRLHEALVHGIELQAKLNLLQEEQAREIAYVQDTTTQLVEIAAQLQGEIAHNAEVEQEHLLTARADIVAQAGAALRHEINNPLFAIIGSADLARRRLEGLGQQSGTDLTPIYGALDRILRGATRIQQVVEAISGMLTPATTDYVAGVPMLDLHGEASM
jgi:signal transduction histidine kinase